MSGADRFDREGGEPIDRLVDAYFDGALDPDRRARLLGHLRENNRRAEEIAKLSCALRLFKSGVPVPDQRREILRKVHAKRGFVGSTARRLVQAGRVAAVLALAGGLLGIALTQKWAPEATMLVALPSPVSDIVDAGQSEANAGMTVLARSVEGQTRELTDLLGSALGSVSFSVRAPAHGRMAMVGAIEAPVLAAEIREAPSPMKGRTGTVAAARFDGAAVVIPLGYVSSGHVGAVDWSSTSPARNPLVLPSRATDLDWDLVPGSPGAPQVAIRRGW